MPYKFVLVDGCGQSHIPVDDRGLHYGDGVFTTALVWHGTVVYEAAHIARLQADAGRLGLQVPSRWLLASELGTVAQRLGTGVLKYMLTRGSGARGYAPKQSRTRRILLATGLPERPESLWRKGVAIAVSSQCLPLPAVLPGVKHLNCLSQVLASRERPDWAQESLLLDANGQVVGGSMSNLFFVKHGELHTPATQLAGIRGIMRGELLRIAAQIELPAYQGGYTLQDIQTADEVFVTNAVLGLWPVVRLDAQMRPVGPVTRLLAGQCGHPLAARVAN